jgi:hypothetical protein
MIPRYGSATAPSITDEELLHLALAYVKRVHGQDPDLPARVAFLLEALREGRGEWERVGAEAWSGPAGDLLRVSSMPDGRRPQ